MRLNRMKPSVMSLFLLISTFLMISFQNCSMVSAPQDFPASVGSVAFSSTGLVPFADLQQKIITPKCLACHAAGAHNFSTYATTLASGTIIPGNMAGSTFYQQIDAGLMPAGKAPLAAAEKAAIGAWIDAGAWEVPVVAPTGTTSLAAGNKTQTSINLTWNLPTTGTVTSLAVERGAVAAGPFTSLATLAATTTAYSSAGLTANLSYSYRVKTTYSTGVSVYSSVFTASTLPYSPSSPSALTATVNSQSQISLTWLDNSSNETGFIVERSLAATGPFAVVFTSAANIVSWADSGLNASTAYYYRVTAVNSGGNSTSTDVVSAQTTAAPLGIPTMPATISVTAISGTQAKADWTDSSNNESGFTLERATAAAGPFTVIANVGSGTITYSDASLSPVTTYYYRVSAKNLAGASNTKTSVAVTTFGTFAWIKANVSSASCTGCHSTASPIAGLDTSSYSGTMTKVVANSSASSLLYSATLSGSMPPSGPKLTTIQLNAIKTWIDSGAPNN